MKKGPRSRALFLCPGQFAGLNSILRRVVTVGTDGTVTSSRVVHASPPRVFDREALAAVNRWRFQPVGSPVTTRRKIEFKPAD